ncbi:MAG: hypothetical protein AAGI71_15070 [Bacteroidota bacterium]
MSVQTAPRASSGSRLVASGLALWFVVALAVSLSGGLGRVPVPVIGATIFSLVALSALALRVVAPLRAWAAGLSVQRLVLFHSVRFVGLAFLVLHARGVLPDDFALVAGWGDIATATTALLVAFAACPITSSARWWIVGVWNTLGLVDILNVLRGAIQIGLANPADVAVLTVFPMSLLPTFVVPLIIVTHGLIFIKLWQQRTSPRL